MLVLPSSTLYGPYPATVIRAKDGDTVLLDINTWPSVIMRISVREFGIDTPELRTRNKKEKALAVQATYKAEQFLHGKLVHVDNVVYGKFAGRVLGSIYADGESLGEYMLSIGMAKEYYGGTREAWFSTEESNDD